MSKSLGNTIGLLESPESIWKKLAPAKTDPRRKRRQDAGVPEDCNVFTSYHLHFSSAPDLAWVREGCTGASIGCIDCKKRLAANMEAVLGPIREKARDLNRHPDRVHDVLSQGAHRARAIAVPVIEETLAAMGLSRSS